MAHPLHRVHTGRDESDAVKTNTGTSVKKACCNICLNVIKHKPSFRCLPCDFALCSQCYNGFVHPAHVGHPLFFIKQARQLGASWKCGGCEKTGQQIGKNSFYNCEECSFSLCEPCFKPVKLPLHSHWLTRTDVRFKYHLSNGEWRCDCCGGNNGQRNYFPRHCSSCQFDVCDTCSQGWRTPLHQHRLYKADSTLIYQEYYGGWRCDHCSRRFRPDINKNPYHCTECSFDLCERCIRIPDSQEVQPTSNQRIITRTAAGHPVTSPVEDVEGTPTPPVGSDLCLVCLTNAKNATIIHGETGHVCCCFDCAQELRRRGAPCPICRAPIELIIKQFNA